MGLLSDFFISTTEEFATYGESDSFNVEDRCQYKYITPLEASSLLITVEGGSRDPVEGIDEFKLLTPEEGDEWTMSCPPKFLSLMASLNDGLIASAAERCVSSISTIAYTVDDYVQLLSDLRRLATRAEATGKSMYLWNSL